MSSFMAVNNIVTYTVFLWLILLQPLRFMLPLSLRIANGVGNC